jgi:hypothetical protein
MRIHILFPFAQRAWGGANQFLKGLKNCFENLGIYTMDPRKAECVLFNSHHYLKTLMDLRRVSQGVFVHRVDGPVSLVRGHNDGLDNLIYMANGLLGNATIFQSSWSREQNYIHGLQRKPFELTVLNAPDSSTFNRFEKRSFISRKRIRLIATSWSDNWNKGFMAYKWLDENLDFCRYEMTFVGNSPITFKNIRNLGTLSSRELALELKNSHIFITASQKDPCSNSLIEALHCGLPAVALRDGGHPEIVGRAGELFDNPNQIPELLNKIVTRYFHYQRNIVLPTLEEVATIYHEFFKHVYDTTINLKENNFNRSDWKSHANMRNKMYYWNMKQTLKIIKSKILDSLFLN